MSEIFISADIEADGRAPGINSMISLGSVAFRIEKENGFVQLATFEKNLLELDGAVQDPEIMQWWRQNPEAWEYCRRNPEHPASVMRQYLSWIKSLPGSAGFIAYPVSYDFMFVYWYLYRFTNERPFGYGGMCIKSYAMGMFGCPSWLHFGKKKIPEKYKSPWPHDHTPLNDAIEQGQLFAALYRKNVFEMEP